MDYRHKKPIEVFGHKDGQPLFFAIEDHGGQVFFAYRSAEDEYVYVGTTRDAMAPVMKNEVPVRSFIEQNNKVYRVEYNDDGTLGVESMPPEEISDELLPSRGRMMGGV